MTEPAAPPAPPAPETAPPAKTDAPPDQTPAEPKTFTQAEVDRIAGDRAARERAKFSDYAEIKAKADKLAEIEAANQTDLEKAVNTAREEARREATQAGNQRLINAEVRALAAHQGFRDPHDAVAQLRDTLSSVTVTDEGVDAAALTAALTDLAEKKPYLIDSKPTGVRPDLGQGARLNSPEALSQAEYEQYYPNPPTRK